MSIRKKIMRGGINMGVRRGVGMMISLAALVFVTRVIGVKEYGVFVAALAMQSYLVNFCQLGINVYLIRSSQNPGNQDYAVATLILLLCGLIVSILVLLLLPLIQNWVNLEGFSLILKILLASVPIQLLSLIPTSILERDIEYGKVAVAEVVIQIINVATAIPLAVLGFGALAPAVGLLLSNLVGIFLLYYLSGQRMSLSWNKSTAKDILRYGLGYSSSVWIWQLRLLVNPVIVSHFAGAAAVGAIALAIRFVDLLSFVKSVVYRLSITLLSKIQDDPSKVRKALNEGIGLQVISIGPLLAIFAVTGPSLIKRFFDGEWKVSMEIFPFIALGVLINSVFNMHSSVLYVYKMNFKVSLFHLFHVSLFFLFSLILIPRFGIIGYGMGELLALLSYFSIHTMIKNLIGPPDYKIAILFGIPCGFLIFFHYLGVYAFIPLVVAACMPNSYKEAAKYYRSVKYGSK